MAATHYAILCQFLIIIGCSLFSLYASLFLLFRKPAKKFQTSRTPVVFLYFWFTTTCSISLLIYSGYTVIWWRPYQVFYNPMVLYFVSGLPTIYVNLVPVADFYLCVDRCCAFAFPFLFQKRFKLSLAIAFLATDVTIFLIYFIMTNYFAFSSATETTTCVYYICLIWKLKYPLIMTYVKYIFCGLTLAASVTLFVLNFLKKSSQISNKLNKPIIIMCAIHVSFAFIPGLILPVLITLLPPDINFTEILGDTSMTCVCISNALSIQVYFKAFRKNFLKPATPSEQTF